MSTLYWLNNDLRMRDNPALAAAATDESLTCVFCIDPRWFRTDRFGNRRMGAHRWRFLRESLLDLHQQFSRLGQTLHLLEGSPRESLPALLATGPFTRVVRTRQHNSNAINVWHSLQTSYPAVSFEQYDSATLYPVDVVTSWTSFPETFSAFKKDLADTPFRAEVPMPSRLPKPASIDIDDRLIESPASSAIVQGGATAAYRHLNDYFDSRAASNYRETRNNLTGRHYSTGFSPWLGNGSLSPLEVLQRLRRYEAAHGANDSTGWILFELLWREFFQWYGYAHGDRLFQFSGINGQRPLTTFYRERFLKWREGRTPWPIVNACMAELRETGLLSNRGRQLVASCLVNELGLDWRCGAGYFEEQLIDYDPCSNWGNWQYIAGVGADPRGGRYFNLEQQADTWDPDGDYRRRWAGEQALGPLDSVDYYDWPIMTGAS